MALVNNYFQMFIVLGMYNFDWMCKFLVQISRALHVKFANAFEILDWYQNTNCQLCQDKSKIKAELKKYQ